jgi:hypothetical protein
LASRYDAGMKRDASEPPRTLDYREAVRSDLFRNIGWLAFALLAVCCVVALVSRRATTNTPPANARSAEAWRRQRGAAIDYLEGVLRSFRDTIPPLQAGVYSDLVQYRESRWLEAIARLRNAPRESDAGLPHLVLAMATPQGDDTDGLSLLWLESGFTVTGVALTDSKGSFSEVASFRPYTEQEKEGYSTTLIRTAAVTVYRRTGSEAPARTVPQYASIVVPRSTDWSTLRVRLRRGDVQSPELTPVFLNTNAP